MQDLRSITSGGGGGGGASRIFGGDRRLRPYPNQPLKCPRCDSLNTKFCYYNNYNLSQPRHFCKSCRRYWTKGGVLRNVPVGGGCRKTKRSNKPKPSSDQQIKERKSTSYSSSDSSGITATTTGTTATTEAASSSSAAVLANFPLVSQPTNLNFEPSILDNFDQSSSDGAGIFTGTNLMSMQNPGMVGFNFSSEISPFRLHHHQEEREQRKPHIEEQINHLQQQEKIMMMEELKMLELTVGCVDQTELSMPGFHQKPVSNGELTASDWQLGSGDHGGGLLDLPSSTIDNTYWSQSQWIDHDHHLFLPP